MRDYRRISERVTALATRGWRVEAAFEAWGYPIFTVERRVKRVAAPTVFLTGGMHGEEPAGVEGVLSWLEDRRWQRWPVNWLVVPCINPYGWERNQRRNRQRCDINRHFRRRSHVPEAEWIKRLVKGRRFLCSMEFHEDVDASGYYLYEARRHGEFLGERVVAAVGKVVQINREPVIDGNEATAMGIIRRDITPARMRQRALWPMAYHLYNAQTDNIFGSETPVTVALARRAQAHRVALETVLNELAPRR